MSLVFQSSYHGFYSSSLSYWEILRNMLLVSIIYTHTPSIELLLLYCPMSTSILIFFLSKSSTANTGFFVNLFFSSLNAFPYFFIQSHFWSFLTKLCNGLAMDTKSLMNC